MVCNGRPIGPLRGSYSGAPEGQPLAIINSMGLLEIALNRGRAAFQLDAHVGTEVRLTSANAGPALERE